MSLATIQILQGLIQQPSQTEPRAGAEIVSGGSGTAKRIFYKMCSGVPWGQKNEWVFMFTTNGWDTQSIGWNNHTGFKHACMSMHKVTMFGIQ